MGRRKNGSSFIGIILFAVIVGLGVYVYFSSDFEREAPQISLQEQSRYWNLKKPLHLTISDASGLAAYKVILKSSKGEQVLVYEKPLSADATVNLDIKPPRGSYTMKDKKLSIVVMAQDRSKWNFFKGNSAAKRYDFIIDRKRPQVSVVANSYKIQKGGSALVIFEAQDDNLDKLYIQGKNAKEFAVEPFYKEGFYIALLAWPVEQKSFKATIVATDLAGNVTKRYVPLYLKDKRYRVSKIKLSDRFLKGKIYDLAEEFEETQGVDDKLEQFKIINEEVREKNEQLIHKITSKVPSEMIDNFTVRRMYPLKNGAVVAHFGDHRLYYYNGRLISEAWHLGLDLASHAMAPIVTRNYGKVVFADFNGLYGNNLIISHGLGLYTLYGHCSNIDVNVGDEVRPGEKIANTGKTGYAMGDHLHFGVLVQGIEVRPQEWMDKKWIKLNISDIIKSAKKIINQK